MNMYNNPCITMTIYILEYKRMPKARIEKGIVPKNYKIFYILIFQFNTKSTILYFYLLRVECCFYSF